MIALFDKKDGTSLICQFMRTVDGFMNDAGLNAPVLFSAGAEGNTTACIARKGACADSVDGVQSLP